MLYKFHFNWRQFKTKTHKNRHFKQNIWHMWLKIFYNVEFTPATIRHWTFDFRHSSLNIRRYSTLNIRLSTFVIEHSTIFDIGHWTLNIRHSTLNIEHWTFDIENSTLNIRHWTFDIRHSTFNFLKIQSRPRVNFCRSPSSGYLKVALEWISAGRPQVITGNSNVIETIFAGRPEVIIRWYQDGTCL